MRTVIVFRLRPIATDQPVLPDQASATADRDVFKKTQRERRHVDGFVFGTKETQKESKRREAQLVDNYSEWLVKQGYEVAGGQIDRSGGRSPLRPDLYDVDADELVEAKSTTSRPHIRLAVGQILDYARYAPDKKRAVLTPVRPEEDMVELLLSHGISLISRSDESFERVEPARPGVPVVA